MDLWKPVGVADARKLATSTDGSVLQLAARLTSDPPVGPERLLS
jgi:hypothetical protein